MAKFKVGDKVKVKNPPHHTSDEVGVIKDISGTGRPGDPVMAEVHYGEGATWGNYGVIYASPSIMRLANSRACNARYSASTPLKRIDYQLEDLYGSNAKLGDLVQEYKAKRYVEYVDRSADTMARDKVYDALEALTGIKCKWAVNSANPVVQNALAAKNAGIWESAKEAEDRSDVFVRAALGRTKYNFDTEAGTLREVIKLLASAEQTPKIKKNTEKLKGILSRVEKAGALFKGI